MTITYDTKISKQFSGVLRYTKTDYLIDNPHNKLNYAFYFKEGELTGVYLTYLFPHKNGGYVWKSKILDHKKFNQEFWVKAPKFLTFDNCNWKRNSIKFNVDGLNNMTISEGFTKMVV